MNDVGNNRKYCLRCGHFVVEWLRWYSRDIKHKLTIPNHRKLQKFSAFPKLHNDVDRVVNLSIGLLQISTSAYLKIIAVHITSAASFANIIPHLSHVCVLNLRRKIETMIAVRLSYHDTWSKFYLSLLRWIHFQSSCFSPCLIKISNIFLFLPIINK